MKLSSRYFLVALLIFTLGCSAAVKGPVLAPVDGEVIVNGQPIAGASVLFIPEKGSVAMGVTDAAGKFRLSTGTSKGAVVGNCKAAIYVPGADQKKTALPPQPKTQAEMDVYMKKLTEMRQASANAPAVAEKPLIPEKYAKAETSGLSYTIKADGANHFKIELQ